MRDPRLLVLAVMAVAATAFASPASAQTLEITDEATGNHCAAVTTFVTDVNGGCLTHANSEGLVSIRKHIFGIESTITNCYQEFAMRLSEDGTGYILEQAITGAMCARQACVNTAEPTQWPVSAFEGTPDFEGVFEGTEYLFVTFCVEPVGGGTEEGCSIDYPFQSRENQHSQEYGHVGEMPSRLLTGFRCEVIGHWNSETGGTHDGQAEQEVVVAHL